MDDEVITTPRIWLIVMVSLSVGSLLSLAAGYGLVTRPLAVANSAFDNTPEPTPTPFTPKPTIEVPPKPMIRPSDLPHAPVAFTLEDTGIRVAEGPWNIAWSHRGEWLAYVSGFSLYLVPDGRWNETRRVFYASIDDGPWDLDAYALAWSPDDSSIGVTLLRYGTHSNNEHYSEWHIAQVDWRKGTFSLIAPVEQAMFLDWSVDNRILAYRRDPSHDLGTEEILNLDTGVWQPILHPVTGKFGVGRPRWDSDGMLLLVYSSEYQVNAAAIYKVDPETNKWQFLPVMIDTYYLDTSLPVPSPDGRWIAWVEGDMTAHGVVSRILLYDRKRNEIIQAADSTDNGTCGSWESLAWSPDSRRLAFSGGCDAYDRRIWIMNVNFSDL